MRTTGGYRFKKSLHEAIVRDVDYRNAGCPFCGARPDQCSPPSVPHYPDCDLMAIIRRVDAVVSQRAGKRIQL
jgi:hypothetical protein